MQDDGHETGSSYVSGPVVLRHEFPTATSATAMKCKINGNYRSD